MRKGSRSYRLFGAEIPPTTHIVGPSLDSESQGDGAPPTSSARRSLATWLAPTYLAYYYRNLRPTPTGCELSWDTRCQEKDDPPWSVPTVWHPMADHIGWRKYGAPYHPEWVMSKGGVSNHGSAVLHACMAKIPGKVICGPRGSRIWVTGCCLQSYLSLHQTQPHAPDCRETWLAVGAASTSKEHLRACRRLPALKRPTYSMRQEKESCTSDADTRPEEVSVGAGGPHSPLGYPL